MHFKKVWFVTLIFILIISILQSIILKPHLEFGFSPDDIWFFSDFSSLGSNPLLKFNTVWQQAGLYHTTQIYYNGILFSLFGFNYPAYQIATLIFKILSVISVYFLVQVISKNRLLAFTSGFVFAIHYGSVGSYEMVSRTQDYLLIPTLNLFFVLFYFLYKNRPKNILWIILTSAVFFFSFFINPIRAYPFLPFILFLGAIIYFKDQSVSNLRWIAKTLVIIFFPFFLFYLLMGAQGAPYGNFLTNIHRASQGNLQIFLTPLTTIGGLFLIGDNLKFLSSASWDFGSFIPFFLGGPLIFLGTLTLILSKIISKKPIKFFILVFITNFIFEAILFFIINHTLNLPPEIKMNYDTTTYAPAAFLGIYIVILTIFIFKEWVNDKQNIYLGLYLLGMLYAVTSIVLTWVLQDFVYIPLGINGYSTLPSMGISAAIASILVLTYVKFKSSKLFRHFAPSVFLILIPFLLLSNDQIQMYFKRYLDGGGMRASDQLALKDKFWSLVKEPELCNKFFYLDNSSDPLNRYSHSVIMIDRFDRWYNLYGPFKSKIPCPVALLVDYEDKLAANYVSKNGIGGFFYKDYDGKEKFFPLKDFYAFRLQNKDIIDIKEHITEQIAKNK